MITAVDTNILLDILIKDKIYFTESKELLDKYQGKGQLIICEMVYAELASQFIIEKELLSFFSDTGIRLVYSNEKTLWLIGKRWENYIQNRKQTLQCSQCGKETSIYCSRCKSPIKFRQRIISDFIIGAHAFINADFFLTRDRGFYKTYFKDLNIV